MSDSGGEQNTPPNTRCPYCIHCLAMFCYIVKGHKAEIGERCLEHLGGAHLAKKLFKVESSLAVPVEQGDVMFLSLRIEMALQALGSL